MIKLKKGLIHLVVLLTSTFSAYYFENYYRTFIREIFKFFYGNNVNFIGKDFHLFANAKFVIAFGIFCTIVFYYFIKALKSRISFLLLTIFTFFATTIISSYLDITDRFIKCTACKDNTRTIVTNEIDYDFHFIISLIIALLPLLFVAFKNRKMKTDLIKSL